MDGGELRKITKRNHAIRAKRPRPRGRPRHRPPWVPKGPRRGRGAEPEGRACEAEGHHRRAGRPWSHRARPKNAYRTTGSYLGAARSLTSCRQARPLRTAHPGGWRALRERSLRGGHLAGYDRAPHRPAGGSEPGTAHRRRQPEASAAPLHEAPALPLRADDDTGRRCQGRPGSGALAGSATRSTAGPTRSPSAGYCPGSGTRPRGSTVRASSSWRVRRSMTARPGTSRRRP